MRKISLWLHGTERKKELNSEELIKLLAIAKRRTFTKFHLLKSLDLSFQISFLKLHMTVLTVRTSIWIMYIRSYLYILTIYTLLNFFVARMNFDSRVNKYSHNQMFALLFDITMAKYPVRTSLILNTVRITNYFYFWN